MKNSTKVLRYNSYEGEGGEGEGGETITMTATELQAKIDAATNGLKAKNTEVLGKLDTLKGELSKFDGVNLDSINKMTAFFDQHEEAELLKDGKMEEVIKRRVQREAAGVENKYKELATKAETLETEAGFYKTRYQSKVVDDQLRTAAIKAGVAPAAVEDILLRGRDLFSLDADDNVEVVDKNGDLVKVDGKVLTPDVFIESLRKDKPHYWPASRSGGSSGDGGDAGATDASRQLDAAAKSGNMAEYRRLRELQKKSSSGS